MSVWDSSTESDLQLIRCFDLIIGLYKNIIIFKPKGKLLCSGNNNISIDSIIYHNIMAITGMCIYGISKRAVGSFVQIINNNCFKLI